MAEESRGGPALALELRDGAERLFNMVYEADKKGNGAPVTREKIAQQMTAVHGSLMSLCRALGMVEHADIGILPREVEP